MKMLMVHRWFNFLVDIVFTFFWKACQNICTNFWCCCFESRILLYRNSVACPSQSKLFLSFQSVHSDMVYDQALLDRISICSSHKSKELMFFPRNIRVRPLT